MSLAFIIALYLGFGALGHGIMMRSWREEFGDTEGAPHWLCFFTVMSGPLALLVAAPIALIILWGEDE